MKFSSVSICSLLCLTAITCAITAPASAQNFGDFSGGVAIGSSYAGVNTAPTNGLIVQGHTIVGSSAALWGTGLEIFSSSAALALPEFSADGNASFVTMSKSRSSTVGTNTAVQNGDFIGALVFDGANGTNYQQAAIIGSKVDGTTISTTSMPGRLEFYTTASGSVTPTLALTINSSQKAIFSGQVSVGSFASASSTTVCQNGNVLSTCSSARRYKENIEPSELGLKEVLAMKPVTFDFRDHEGNWERHDFGFVAEDMEKINPLFVTYNADGKIEGVRYMQLTAVNAKAIQEEHSLWLNHESLIERQQAQIDAQQRQFDAQQKEIDQLKHALEHITHTNTGGHNE